MIKEIGLILILTISFVNANTQYSQSVLTKKIYPMGKKIFDAKCKNSIKLIKYKSITELQNSIVDNKLCKKIKNKQIEAVSLYLWNIKKVNNQKDTLKVIKLKHKEKCPVCGMFVYKYPKWIAQIIYSKNSKEYRLSFDGVKDLMKFYFEPNAWGKYDSININNIQIVVTDYYTQNVIDGFKAFYVLRSDVYGPMGHELIPFKYKKDAKSFRLDHNAKYIISFDEITQKVVYDLDE